MSSETIPRMIKVDPAVARDFWHKVREEEADQTSELDLESEKQPEHWADSQEVTKCPCCFGHGIVPYPGKDTVPAILSFVEEKKKTDPSSSSSSSSSSPSSSSTSCQVRAHPKSFRSRVQTPDGASAKQPPAERDPMSVKLYNRMIFIETELSKERVRYSELEKKYNKKLEDDAAKCSVHNLHIRKARDELKKQKLANEKTAQVLEEALKQKEELYEANRAIRSDVAVFANKMCGRLEGSK